MKRIIKGNDLPLGFYAKNRSGYEGCQFLMEKTAFGTITAKSNEYKEKCKNAERFPIVLFPETYERQFLEAEELEEKIWVVTHNTSSRKSASILYKWYKKNFEGLHSKWAVGSAYYEAHTETTRIHVHPINRES